MVTALANYDAIGNTIEKLPLAKSRIPRKFVKRAVDDQSTATPASSGWVSSSWAATRKSAWK
jgi:hypothetical protein